MRRRGAESSRDQRSQPLFFGDDDAGDESSDSGESSGSESK
jgi:hypothetical protein